MKEINLLELLKTIWSERKSIALWGGIAMIAGIVVAFSIPREYTSVIKVVPESNAGTQSTANSMGALAGMMGLNLGSTTKSGITVEIYPQVVNSIPFLNDMSQIYVPYKKSQITLFSYLTEYQKAPWWSMLINIPSKVIGWFSWPSDDVMPESDILNDSNTLKTMKPTNKLLSFENTLKSRITFSDNSKAGIIALEIKMQDPTIAAIVADSVISRLQYYMTQYYTSKARYELNANQVLLDKARQKYYASDSAHAVAVDRNQNLISKSAQIKIERLLNERSLTYSIYQQLNSQVEMSKIKVQEDTPIVTVLEPARESLIPSSPNKKMIAGVMLFVGAFIRIAFITLITIYKNNKADIVYTN